MTANTEWLAERTYFSGSTEAAETRPVVVAIGPPRKLKANERPVDSPAFAYGCTIQTGSEFTKRVVGGRDAMEALFHGLLSIDMFLVTLSRKGPLTDGDGKGFVPSADGLLSGPMGKEYLREMTGNSQI